ncbi:MAG: branched-chain amino acid ABC transporter permease [Firmicutes bacterium]|nr:branched-chain amino acid ABC transporter permease [Bacillota bacterium]
MDPVIYVLDTLIFVGIFALLSLSLNLEYGLTGLGNFGKVAFFMAGAYTYALLAAAGFPVPASLAGAALTAGLLGGLITLPALRLREDYLAIVTLSFGEILRLIVKAEKGLAGGVWGFTVPSAFPGLASAPRLAAAANLAVVWAAVAAAFAFLQLLAHSPYGRVLRGIREDDVAAAALGKDVVRYKAQALVAGSALAGLAGGLFAQYVRFIDPYMFMPTVTFSVWIMLILGGPGNNWGALLGALLVELMNRGTRIAKDYLQLAVDPNNMQFIMFGLLVILIIFYRPEGLLREGPVKTAARGRAYRWTSSS